MYNEDLLSALKELLEASNVITSGQLPTESQLERYMRAKEWASRLVNREESSKSLVGTRNKKRPHRSPS